MAGFAPIGSNPFRYQVGRNTSPQGEGAAVRSAGGPPGATPVAPMTPEQQRMAELMTDPAYASATVAATRNANDAASTRQASLRALAIQMGGLPAGFQDKYGDIDQATLDAANANQFSQYANQQHDARQQAIDDRLGLAARGAEDSGATQGVIGQENYNNGKAMSALGDQFGSSVGSALSAYTGALNTNANNLTDATFKAEQDQKINPAYTATAPLPVNNTRQPLFRPTIPLPAGPIGGTSPAPAGPRTVTPRAAAPGFAARAI